MKQVDMKKTTPYILLSIFILLFLGVIPGSAQQKIRYRGQVKINLHEVKQRGDSVHIKMDINLTNFHLEDDRSLVMTPFFSSASQDKYLPEVVINGKSRHKIFLREVSLPGYYENDANHPYDVVRIGDQFRQIVHYNVALPFEEWMKEASFKMEQDFCGCAGYTQQVSVDMLAEKISTDRKPVPPPPGKMSLKVTYIRPPVEAVKARSESQEVYLDFPVAQTTIYPDFGNNYSELNKIEKIVRDIRDDKNIQVNRVSIAGNASPEGNERSNHQLSHGRAEALRNFLSTRVNIPFNVFNVESKGEDWAGLAKAVERAPMTNKNEILAIIQYTFPIEARKQQIRRIDGGRAYQYMLQYLYPPLRRVTCQIDYTVRSFSVQEGKEVFKKQPHLLSLEEMYQVANTYKTGSREFNEVFLTAVRMFPNDPVANLNAGATALMQKDLVRAERHFNLANKTSAEYMNNMAIFHVLKKDYQQASRYFAEAAKKGVKGAKENYEQLQRIMKKIPQGNKSE